MIKLLYPLLIALIILLIILVIWKIFRKWRETDDTADDKVYQMKKHVFYAGSTVLQMVKRVYSDDKTSKISFGKRIGVAAAADIGRHLFEGYFDPVKSLRKKLEPRFRKALTTLEDARQNAINHKSKEAVEHVRGCFNQINMLNDNLSDVESVVQVINQIEEIIAQANAISDADVFNDEGSLDDNYDPNQQQADPKVDTRTHYEILGVDKNATQEEIKKGYKEKARKWHEDKHRDEKLNIDQKLKDFLNEEFSKISTAYNVLKDPEERRKYDETIP